MHLQVFPRITAADSTAAETQEDEGESSEQEYESATDTEDTEQVEDTLGEGEGDGECEEGDLGDLGDAPLAELMCMEQSECDQVWIYNYTLLHRYV